MQAHCDGCELDDLICTLAASNGHLEILKWARENGCPWDGGKTCECAASGEHPNIIRWILENGGSWDKMHPMQYNNVEVLQLAYVNRVAHPGIIATHSKECVAFLERYEDAWSGENYDLPTNGSRAILSNDK